MQDFNCDIHRLQRIQELTNAAKSLAGVKRIIIALEEELDCARHEIGRLQAHIGELAAGRRRRPWPTSTGITAATSSRSARPSSASGPVDKELRSIVEEGSVL